MSCKMPFYYLAYDWPTYQCILSQTLGIHHYTRKLVLESGFYMWHLSDKTLQRMFRPLQTNKKKTITQNKTNTQAKNCLPLKIKVKTNSPLRCVADSIKVALGVGKLLFGFHSSKSLHYSICPNDQLPKQPFFDLAVYDSEAIGQNWKFFTTPLSELKYKILIFWILYALLSLRFTRICYMSMTTIF